MNEAANHVLSLLAEHGPRLHALLVRITLREDAAEDLMQDLFQPSFGFSSFIGYKKPVCRLGTVGVLRAIYHQVVRTACAYTCVSGLLLG